MIKTFQRVPFFLRLATGLGGLVFLSTLPAGAATIEIAFQGSVTQSSVPGIAAGDPFSGLMVYETSGTVLGGSSGYINYGFFQPADGVSIAVDGFSFAGGGYLNMFLARGPNNESDYGTVNTDILQGSSDDVFGSVSTTYSGLSLDNVVAQFLGNLNFLGSYAVPSPFDVGDLILPGTSANPTTAYVQLDNGTTDFTFNGSIADVEIVPDTPAVPEPSVVLLAGSGLLCLIGLRGFVRSKR